MSVTKRRVASQSPHFLKMAFLKQQGAFEAKWMDSKVVRAGFGSGLIRPGLKHAAR